MTYPAWPALLGPPQQPGYARAAGDGRRRTRTDAGPGAVNRRFSAVVDRVSLSFQFDTEKLGIFWKWYREEVDQGAGLFTMPNWLADGWPLLDEAGTPVLDEGGAPVLVSDIWLCRFGERLPEEKPVEGSLQVLLTFDVEVMP